MRARAFAVSVVSIAAMLAIPHAHAQMQLFEGFDEQDPIGSAVKELHERVLAEVKAQPARCGVTGDVPTYFFSGSGSRTKAISDPQRRAVDNLILQNLESLAPGSIKSIDEIGAVLAMQDKGDVSSFDALLKENRESANFEVVAEIARIQSANYNMSLRARGAAPGNCAIDVAVPVAPEYMPVLFMPSQALFGSAATQIYKAEAEAGENSEKIVVDVTPPSFGDTRASKQTTTLVQDLLKQGLVKADEDEGAMAARRPDIAIQGERKEQADPQATWLTKIKITESSQGLKVRIDADRPGVKSVIEEGYVPPEESGFAPETRDAGSTKIAMGLEGTEIAIGLRLQFTQGVINALNRRNKYFFAVTEPAVLELGILEDKDGKKYKYALRRIDGKRIKPPIVPKPNRFNTARFIVEPGIHTLDISATAQIQEAYTLRTRMGPMPLDPLAPGTRLGQAGDWLYGVIGEGDKRQCYALTAAVDSQPAGWRVQRPVLQIVISPGDSEKAELPQKIYDRSDAYEKGSAVEIQLVGNGGKQQRLRLTEDKGSLMALQACKDEAGRCIIPDSINQLTYGSTLKMTGTTAAGEASEVTYSLVGYRAAVAAIAAECNNRFIGQEMVRR
jgi:hypothetical protein